MREILEKLTDDQEYYNGVGKNYLSNSDIGTLLRNPKEFGVSRPDTKEFAVGRYFHQLILEPDKAEQFPVVDVATRNNKAYREFIAEKQIEIALLEKEVKDVHSWVSAINSNIIFFDELYAPNNEYEVPMIKEIKGLMWKGKADILAPDKIIDLKSSSNINDFKKKAVLYNYDSQCYIYQCLFDRPLVFYVVDKLTQMVGMFEPEQSFIDRGEEKVEKAIEIYQKFYGDNPTEDIENYFIYDKLI
jgi:hypothetical protein